MARAPEHSRVAVLGASPKPERFSFMAVHMLKQHGFEPIPVHPAGHTVDGIAGVKTLDDVMGPVDTLTMYVGPEISNTEYARIMKLKPRRVIFNPGAENEPLAEKLEPLGIEIVRACTLVLLRTEQF